jgi:hypothetical protein
MKSMPLLAAAALAFSFSFAHAADDAKPRTAQQEKMVTCNKQAEGKKGDDRKAFMKDCLGAKPAAPVTQQDKMKSCNKDAGDMKGDARKKFMSECLKKTA